MINFKNFIKRLIVQNLIIYIDSVNAKENQRKVLESIDMIQYYILILEL